MRRVLFAWLLLTVGFRVTGCASTEELRVWSQHGAHFASGQHPSFSVRNVDSSDPRVTRRDAVLAHDQRWWGRPITVSQDQIIER